MMKYIERALTLLFLVIIIFTLLWWRLCPDEVGRWYGKFQKSYLKEYQQ